MRKLLIILVILISVHIVTIQLMIYGWSQSILCQIKMLSEKVGLTKQMKIN